MAALAKLLLVPLVMAAVSIAAQPVLVWAFPALDSASWAGVYVSSDIPGVVALVLFGVGGFYLWDMGESPRRRTLLFVIPTVWFALMSYAIVANYRGIDAMLMAHLFATGVAPAVGMTIGGLARTPFSKVSV